MPDRTRYREVVEQGERIQLYYVRGTIVALGAHRFQESYELLTRRLRVAEPSRIARDKTREACLFDRARLVSALGALGDRRAIPALRELGSREPIWRGHVAAAIAQIEAS